jgi:5-formyltetrahydrofolate cyclo-ligase
MPNLVHHRGDRRLAPRDANPGGTMTDLELLRRQLRRARLALPPEAQAAAQRSALKRIRHHPTFRRARRIAGYFGSNGEIDPMPLLSRAARMGKRCYLPVLHPFKPGHLWFYRWRPADALHPNRFGIPEPRRRRAGLIPARRLDLAIVPLLGFDMDCNRLGMGGGYYDRTFAFVQRHPVARRPFLLGLAHDSQRVDRLLPQPWDIALDAVVTDCRTYKRRPSR